jgi:chemotaxis protein methyltransferase CheR
MNSENESSGEGRVVTLKGELTIARAEELKAGIYTEEMVAPIPLTLRKKYLLRSKDPLENAVRICTEIRSRVRFGRLNFMEADFGLRHDVNVIFCRNVLIYSDRSTQERDRRFASLQRTVQIGI